MNQNPLVSIICLCYNQKSFVKEAIESVWNQTYENIELIVVDDCSSDGSKDTIQELLFDKDIQFISLTENLGSTAAFNKGFEASKGKYVIDLAADDVLDISRVEKQVAFFESCDEKVGVIYSDAISIDDDGILQKRHFSNQRLTTYTGDIYSEIIAEYFIPTPTMMMRRLVLEALDGYDESLAYEDFDFWIRSARNWHYAYQDEALTYIRKHSDSQSKGLYKKNDKQNHSTYLVCQKIKNLNKTAEENKALITRIRFETRQSVFSGDNKTAELFIELLREIGGMTMTYSLLNTVNKLGLDLSFVRSIYHWLKY